eukprot:TRINITY_DN10465_c0_g1_i1.p2 TRINITY_DN10465_c0_g1~~TRINITY_DN10465_c0_g1_i1.p2  ORF type:complete len:170 (-),score=5.87 TRINITY_DN10465_c0_g1_i1:40-519(-)
MGDHITNSSKSFSLRQLLKQVTESSNLTNVSQTGALIFLATSLYSTAVQVAHLTLEYAKRKIIIRVEIDSRDDIYRWVMHWLSSRQSLEKQKTYSVSSTMSTFGTSVVQTDIGALNHRNPIFFIPSPGVHVIDYKGHWVWIRRSKSKLLNQQCNCNSVM